MGRRLGRYLLSDKRMLQESAGVLVKAGRDLSTNRQITAKIFDNATLRDLPGVKELVKFEICTLAQASGHANVVQLVEVLRSSSKFVVIMEAVAGGDMFEEITSVGRLEDGVARRYFEQVLDAVEHCHLQGICHRDIKPENILIDNRGNVKLTGFALAGLFDPCMVGHVANLMHAVCGTPEYVAPEVVQGNAYDGRVADMWSLGVTLYAMLAGFLPFEAEEVADLFDKAKVADFKFTPGMSASSRSLLERLLEPDPRKRYTIAQVRSHPWLTRRRARRPQRTHGVATTSQGRESFGDADDGGDDCPRDGCLGPCTRSSWDSIDRSPRQASKTGRRWGGGCSDGRGSLCFNQPSPSESSGYSTFGSVRGKSPERAPESPTKDDDVAAAATSARGYFHADHRTVADGEIKSEARKAPVEKATPCGWRIRGGHGSRDDSLPPTSEGCP